MDGGGGGGVGGAVLVLNRRLDMADMFIFKSAFIVFLISGYILLMPSCSWLHSCLF